MSANESLKNDYDLLQEKFDKHMKLTNNINEDLKDEIRENKETITKFDLKIEEMERHVKNIYEEKDFEIAE